MAPNVFPDEIRGFTFIEVLIALVILMFGLLGTLAGFMSAIDYNLQNSIRNEAIQIAQEELESIRNTRYDSVPLGTQPAVAVTRQFRKSNQVFQVIQDVASQSNMRQVTITVQWTHRNKTYSYSAQTLLREFS